MIVHTSLLICVLRILGYLINNFYVLCFGTLTNLAIEMLNYALCGIKNEKKIIWIFRVLQVGIRALV